MTSSGRADRRRHRPSHPARTADPSPCRSRSPVRRAGPALCARPRRSSACVWLGPSSAAPDVPCFRHVCRHDDRLGAQLAGFGPARTTARVSSAIVGLRAKSVRPRGRSRDPEQLASRRGSRPRLYSTGTIPWCRRNPCPRLCCSGRCSAAVPVFGVLWSVRGAPARREQAQPISGGVCDGESESDRCPCSPCSWRFQAAAMRTASRHRLRRRMPPAPLRRLMSSPRWTASRSPRRISKRRPPRRSPNSKSRSTRSSAIASTN